MLLKYLWTPDRDIQGQAKNGLKIAGVTKRWESKCFKYCGPLINILRGDDLLFRHSRNLQSGIHMHLKTMMDPGLKIAGVTSKR